MNESALQRIWRTIKASCIMIPVFFYFIVALICWKILVNYDKKSHRHYYSIDEQAG